MLTLEQALQGASPGAEAAVPDVAPTGAGAIVVVPTFNEAENLTRIVPAILDVLPEARVLVVDDHSPDAVSYTHLTLPTICSV